MGHLSERGLRQHHFPFRRHFLKAGAAASLGFLSSPSVFAQGPPAGQVPADSGRPGRRYVIRGGAVMSMDPKVGDFAQADVLVEGKKIVAVGPNLHAGGAAVIDARGRIVMPGFIDTHHHQFETALRSFLADGMLINDGQAARRDQLLRVHPPQVRAACTGRRTSTSTSCSAALSQLDAGVTTVHDISQIHHSPQHSDAAIQALFDTGRRAAFGYFESAGGVPGNQYPDRRAPASRSSGSRRATSSSHDHGRRGLPRPAYEAVWTIGRQLGSADRGAHPRRRSASADFDALGRPAATSSRCPTTCSST